MKLVSWIVVVAASAVAALAAPSCSIDHRSDGFACGVGQPCANGRMCSDGYCVVMTGPIDSPKLGPDAAIPIDADLCPPGCTSCVVATKQCNVDCAQTSCTAAIKCPAGWHCDVMCSGDNDCRNGINCLDAASCSVECSGTASCRNVVCGPGPCDVTCSGQESCRGVQCGQSCACDVTCSPAALCENVLCSSFQCETATTCTSQPIGCNTCQ